MHNERRFSAPLRGIGGRKPRELEGRSQIQGNFSQPNALYQPPSSTGTARFCGIGKLLVVLILWRFGHAVFYLTSY